MRTRSLEIRIQRLERAAKAQSKFSPACICFPENEAPLFGCEVERDIAARVKCPLHGERFKPRFFIYVSAWLRAKLWEGLRSHHSEQYRKAWFASFPLELWPVEEALVDGKLVLRLKGEPRLEGEP